jgi:hypothetical protein
MFLPILVPSSIYFHFREKLAASVTRLESIDEVEPYLVSRISVHARISESVVLSANVVSCPYTFVGMKQIDKGEVAYVFIIYLQRVTPEAKCSPLFIIESGVGMANDVIQRKIDEGIEITHRRVSRAFLASDGDPSYNDGHHVSMNSGCLEF